MLTKNRCLAATALVLTLALTLSPAAIDAQPQSKRPITHEDVFLMKRVGSPAVSPDGRWAVVSVAEPAYEAGRQTSDLWIVPTDGSAYARRLTESRGPESGVSWSPDSTRLAFAAAGNEGPLSAGAQAALAAAAGRPGLGDGTQIFVLDVTTAGPPQRVTNVSTGARSPRWRPDGKAILFTSMVYPGAKTDDDNKKGAAERVARKWTARVYDGFPIRDWDRWLDDRRPSLLVQELDGTSPARDILAGTALVASPGFGGQMNYGTDDIAAAWHANERVVFAATDNRHEAAFAAVRQSLWSLDLGTGSLTRATGREGSYADPAVHAPDASLFARFAPETDRIYTAARLIRVSEGGRTASLTDGFDRSVGAFKITPDGRAVYFLGEDAGRQKLYRVSGTGGAVQEVGRLDRGTFAAFDLGGPATAPVAVAVWESATNPPELVRVDLASGARRPLTSFNTARISDLDLASLQEFWFTSTKGRRIHNFVALPPGFDPAKKYPLLVVIHGGPYSQWTDQWGSGWNYHLLGAPGYVLLLTNFTGSTGFGEGFAQNIQGDPLDTPGQEILEAVDEAIKRYPAIDNARMAAGGASYGGHLTNWLAVTTTRFKAFVSHAGLFDQVAQWTTSDATYGREVAMGGPVWEGGAVWQAQNPIMKSANLRTPMLVTAGERDFRVPLNNALQLWSVLQRQRVPSRLIVFPGENHVIQGGENSRLFYSEVHAWLARWLGAHTGD